MWKLLFQSVRGPAHVRGGLPCQDHCRVRLRRTPCGSVLIMACSDGAGSAPLADLGSRLVCHQIVERLRPILTDLPLNEITRAIVQSVVNGVRDGLEKTAASRDADLHHLACTLLVAIVGESESVFAQIGDGVIVVGDGDGYRPVFWPQSGEYANSTNFVTDLDWNDHLDFARLAGALDEVALLTDGLQGLALNLTAKNVHVPFFRPMFGRLKTARPGEGLATALRRFLDSPAVNARSDDDKTLILATRVPPRAATPVP